MGAVIFWVLLGTASGMTSNLDKEELESPSNNQDSKESGQETAFSCPGIGNRA